MNYILILIAVSAILLNDYAYAACGYHPPEPQLQARQKSSVTIPEETKNLKKLATITKKEAKKIAVKEYPGKVKKAELTADEGTLVWKLEVKGNEGQKEIFVDPANGSFLGYGLTR